MLHPSPVRRPTVECLPQEQPDDAAIAAIWRERHRHLIDVAYRMLSSVSDAEDVVQEAFTRLLRTDLAQIDDVRGWLVVVVSRICLDQLRSARVRHEAYVGPWLPEPVIAGNELTPEERITLDDSVRMALLVVLEQLSPGERVSFILHDVFQYTFDDIARIMGKTPAACRQLASRARRHVQEEDVSLRGVIDPVEARRVADRFINAAMTGTCARCSRCSIPRRRAGPIPADSCPRPPTAWWGASAWRSGCSGGSTPSR